VLEHGRSRSTSGGEPVAPDRPGDHRLQLGRAAAPLPHPAPTPADEQVRCSTDTDRLAQVFINVLSNARKYCDAEPRLRIPCAARPMVSVDFIDNGSGIPKKSQALIFEKFGA
jgi:signal transduction histidine kinase